MGVVHSNGDGQVYLVALRPTIGYDSAGIEPRRGGEPIARGASPWKDGPGNRASPNGAKETAAPLGLTGIGLGVSGVRRFQGLA